MTTVLAASDSGGGSFLVSPSLGLMIWTLLAFGITLYLLNKLAFPRIAEALDRRRVAIEESIESAQQAKKDADELLEEYRARLREAREQAEDIVARARKAAENVKDETKAEAIAAARAAARPGAPRHRARDPSRARRAPPGGRRPDGRRHGEDHPQVARRGGPSPPHRGGTVGGRLLRAGPRVAGRERQLGHGGDRRGLRPLAVRGREGARRARPRPRRAGRVRRGAVREPRRCRCSCSRRTSPPRRSARA